MLEQQLQAYGIDPAKSEIVPFGTGLINHTWLIKFQERDFILQRINDQVFPSPHQIADNIELIGSYFAEYHPDYLFVHPLRTVTGNTLTHVKGQGWFRLFPFVPDSHTIDVVNHTQEAFEAAKQFGTFTVHLKSFDISSLHITLPDFHNLSLRWQQFQGALESPETKRKMHAAELIQYLKNHQAIVLYYEKLLRNTDFKQRVTHHDTKISNVLFNEKGKGLCVIDLDTVMPGYFISDVGDMLRTYLSPVSEEEQDFTKIQIREDYFAAIANGYLSAMKRELTPVELSHFVYAGKFMIYMQALRFLTDYLNGDIYYGQKYEGHNLVRAGNQATLLQRLMDKEEKLQKIVSYIIEVRHQDVD